MYKKTLPKNAEGNRTLGRSGRRQEYNIKMDIKLPRSEMVTTV
jgi:hypothetical protein